MLLQLCAVLSLSLASALPVSPNGANDAPNLWPLPASFTSGSTLALVDSVAIKANTFFHLSANADVETLRMAVGRYTTTTFPHALPASFAPASSPAVLGLVITVDDNDESFPQLGVDESYTLTVPDAAGNATLSAKTIYGAMRGLETFSQLVTFDHASETFNVAAAPWKIDDAPRFPHRGLMIDSARHFETLQSIRNIIDSLPYAKLNVLHWHMVDSQSFPFQSKSHPKLWDGSYSEFERYTQDDIASIVEYARQRGVRVMVEFDVPGHAASWCTGYPEICPSPTCNQPLNVANNATFDLISDILHECTGGAASTQGKPMGLFPGNMIHLGGDEVDTSCWSKTPAVADWLQKQGMTPDDGYAYFVNRAAGYAKAQGRRPVQWSEVYDHFKTKLDKETIVHIWKSNTNVTEVVANGYNVLINVGYFPKSWYLDNLGTNWTAVYSNEPCADNGVPDDLCKLILGGHGEMWGETVDASDLQQTVWPRLAAIAERLWSPLAQTSDVAAALPRIEYFRCLLNRRGVAAAPVNNANARSAPPGPGGCLGQ